MLCARRSINALFVPLTRCTPARKLETLRHKSVVSTATFRVFPSRNVSYLQRCFCSTWLCMKCACQMLLQLLASDGTTNIGLAAPINQQDSLICCECLLGTATSVSWIGREPTVYCESCLNLLQQQVYSCSAINQYR